MPRWAAFAGQDRYSPYATMGNMPESAVDPNGLVPERSSNNYDGFTSFAMGGGALEGNAGGYASAAWFGGGSGINDINTILSAFGYGGCANIAEWAALNDKIREINATLEASGIGYRINDKGQFEKEWNVGGIYAYADNYFASGGNDASAFQFHSGETKGSDGWAYGKHGNISYKYSFHDDNTNSIGYFGVMFELFVSVSGYTDLNWIQNVITSSPTQSAPHKPCEAFNDVDKNHPENVPFYMSVKNQNYCYTFGAENGFSFYFKDEPGTGITQTDNYVFKAELTLMGRKSGIYQPIITFNWGYIFINDKNNTDPSKLSTQTRSFGPFIFGPSLFQQSLFPQNHKSTV